MHKHFSVPIHLMKLATTSQLGLALLSGAIFASSLRADFIQPVAVQAADNSYNNQNYLIDGTGWLNDTNPPVGSPYSVENPSAANMWFTGGPVKQSLTFDLGQTVNLTQVYVWNFSASPYENAGFKDVEVWVSSETNLLTASNFNAIAQISLTEGGTNGQAFNVTGTNVRLVRLNNLTGWGSGFLIGLAAVRYGSGSVTGNMPWVVLNHPSPGDEFGYHTNALGADIACNMTVTDPDGPADIQMVQVFEVTTTSNLTTTLLATVTNAPYNVVLHGVTNGYHTLRAMATDQSGKVAWADATVFVRQLYADGVIKIDDSADIGPGTNQIAYTGDWRQGLPSVGATNDDRYDQNDHYDGTSNDVFVVTFRGVKIDAYATVASYHGTGMASIDGGPETPVIYTSSQRAGQVFVYGSPVLTNGVHTLQVRVVGDGVITADRFDVQVYNLAAVGITQMNGTVTIDLTSPDPTGQHQLFTSADLVTWQPVPAAVVTVTGDHTIRVSVSGVTAGNAFYRVALSQ